MTTVALLERRTDITRDLFSRYWRDVHGVMAARIPGFESYTQHHVTALRPGSEPFEGIAVVNFRNEEDRQGLGSSPVAAHIHRDERNVFRRALLYNLAPGADEVVIDGEATGRIRFLVVPIDDDAGVVVATLLTTHPTRLVRYDLTTGDPAGWNDTDVDEGGTSRRFGTLLIGSWPVDGAEPMDAVPDDVAAYGLDESHVMVSRGRPTPVGLRGLDAYLTICEAGAENQLDHKVERDLFGA